MQIIKLLIIWVNYKKTKRSLFMKHRVLVINSNLGPISHRYWDTATYWLKIANFSYPLSFIALGRVNPFEFMEMLYGYWNQSLPAGSRK